MDKRDASDRRSSGQKKAWHAPSLSVYGNVEELTRAVGGGVTDLAVFASVPSDRILKRMLEPVDAGDVLSRLRVLPLSNWST
jgi:hypothetical protein